MEKKVSIVMSTYNESLSVLALAIDSILNQTYKFFEFIIILDNPQNNEIKLLIEKYQMKDNRIIIIRNDHNLGLANSLNKGIKASSGEYIARMDSDDISIINRIEMQVLYLLKNSSVDIVSSTCKFMDENGIIVEKNSYCVGTQSVPKLLRYGNIIVHPSVMFRKNIFSIVGGYRNFKVGEDYDFWLRCCACSMKFYIIKEPLIIYRINLSGLSHKNYAVTVSYTLLIQYLYKHNCVDPAYDFSKSNVKYIRKLDHALYEKSLNSAYKKLKYGEKSILQKKYLLGIVKIFEAIVLNPVCLALLFNSIQFRKKLSEAHST